MSQTYNNSSDLVCEAPVEEALVCEAPVDQARGNGSEQENLPSGDGSSGGGGGGTSGGSGGGSGGGDTQWWKTAPKFEVPWPPGADKQSKTSLSWDKGPSLEHQFPEMKWPSDGRETLFEAPPVQVQTPVPGVVIDLFAKAEYGLSIAGSIGAAIKKDGDTFSVTGKGSVTGKAVIGVKGGIGVGLGGGGVSIGVSGNLEALLEATLTGSIEIAANYKGGNWFGTLKAPLSFQTAIKVVPSASLYVKVWKWNKDLATLTFGEWTIATAGITWTPGVKLDGGKFSNLTEKPKLIGPQWGTPPEAKEKTV